MTSISGVGSDKPFTATYLDPGSEVLREASVLERAGPVKYSSCDVQAGEVQWLKSAGPVKDSACDYSACEYSAC